MKNLTIQNTAPNADLNPHQYIARFIQLKRYLLKITSQIGWISKVKEWREEGAVYPKKTVFVLSASFEQDETR